MTKHKQHGMSLIEVVVVLAIASVIMLMVLEIMDDALRVSLFVESRNDLAVFGQETINQIQREVFQSRTIFDNSALGQAYRNAVVLPAAYPVQADSLLPVVDPVGEVEPDTGTGANRETGNVLLMVRQLTPLRISYDHDANPVTPNVDFLADRHRFQMYFLSRNTARNFGGAGYYLDLIEAKSDIYADLFQMVSAQALVPNPLAQITAGLTAAGITRAWDPGATAIGSAFKNVSCGNDGDCNNDPFIAAPTIPIPNQPVNISSLLPELRGGRIAGRMEYTVGFRQSAAAEFPVNDRIPRYAVFDTAFPNFPSGFEVKIAGPAGARKVLTRMVLLAQYGVDKWDSRESLVITGTTDR